MEQDELNFEIVDHQGKPLRANVHVVCRDLGGQTFEIDGTSGADGGVTLSVPPMSRLEYVVVQAEGFWTFHSDEAEDFETLMLIRLPELDRAAWWLQTLGIDATDTGRGSEIKVAVIDADFRPGAGLEDVSGGEVAGTVGNAQNWGQSWGHGEMVCRILCDRQPSSMAYFSAAPGANVIFADATGDEGGVDPATAISAILKLVSHDDVDIISLSWGDREELAGTPKRHKICVRHGRDDCGGLWKRCIRAPAALSGAVSRLHWCGRLRRLRMGSSRHNGGLVRRSETERIGKSARFRPHFCMV